MNLGTTIDEIYDLREDIRVLENQIKDINEVKKTKEMEVMEHLQQQNLDKASGSKATVSLSVSVIPSVKEWDDFFNYIHRHKAYHLLQRRAATAAYREELDLRNGKSIPGVESFNKSNLSVRSR